MPAVPSVLENSILLYKSMDKDGKNIENNILAAPVLIENEKYFVVIRVRHELNQKIRLFPLKTPSIPKDI